MLNYLIRSYLRALTVLRLAMVLKAAVYVGRVRPCHEIWAFFIIQMFSVSKARQI